MSDNTTNETISQTLLKFEEAWNIHDAKAFSQIFAQDADFTNVFGQTAKGRNEIEKFHAPMFSGMFKTSKLKIHEKSIRMLKPDVAAVDARWTMSGAMGPDGNPWPDRKGLMNLIMMPKGEDWVVTVMHNMDLPDALPR